MKADLLYPDLSYRVIGCCFEVYNFLGPFYQENVYQRALEIELSHRQIQYERKRPVQLFYRDEKTGLYELDLVVENRIILELKSVEMLHPRHLSQMIQYLAATGVRLGIVINFGSLEKLAYRRIPHEPANHANNSGRVIQVSADDLFCSLQAAGRKLKRQSANRHRTAQETKLGQRSCKCLSFPRVDPERIPERHQEDLHSGSNRFGEGRVTVSRGPGGGLKGIEARQREGIFRNLVSSGVPSPLGLSGAGSRHCFSHTHHLGRRRSQAELGQTGPGEDLFPSRGYSQRQDIVAHQWEASGYQCSRKRRLAGTTPSKKADRSFSDLHSTGVQAGNALQVEQAWNDAPGQDEIKSPPVRFGPGKNVETFPIPRQKEIRNPLKTKGIVLVHFLEEVGEHVCALNCMHGFGLFC